MNNHNKVLREIQPGTRILFANVPADGHFNPLTGLAVYLKEKGCIVRWYTSDTYAAKISSLGIPHYPLNKAIDISGRDIESIFPERAAHKSKVGKLVFDLVHLFILRGPEYYADIKDIYEDFPFDVMIADIAFGGIPFVKEKMRIPVFSVGVFPVVASSRDLPPHGLGMTPSTNFQGKLKARILRTVARKVLFAKPNRIMRSVLAEYGIDDEGLNVFDLHIHKSTMVLQSGIPQFEYYRSDLHPNIRYVGALLPYVKESARAPWFDERLNKYRNVILVTQGTVEKDNEKLLVPVLEAFQNTDALLVVTTGGTGTQALRERYPWNNIIIEDFIPFADIMPYADVYVTNGGYGGVLLSIRNELPMVVAGLHEGKNEINARVGYFGLGIDLQTEKPAVEKIRAAVEKVLSDPSYKVRVKVMAGAFSGYNANALSAAAIAAVTSPVAGMQSIHARPAS